MKTFKELREEVQSVTEGERGLWDNIHAKRKRIKSGSGERMRKPYSKGAPTKLNFKDSMSEDIVEVEELFDLIEDVKSTLFFIQIFVIALTHNNA